MKKKSSIFASQKVIVLLVVFVLFAFFSLVSENFRQYSTVMSILDYSYYIVLMAIGVTFPLITGGVDLSGRTGLICYSLAGGYLITQKGLPAEGSEGGWFRNIFKITTAGGTKIPIGFLWMILIVIIMAFVLNHTKMGRYTIAIGRNKEATSL